MTDDTNPYMAPFDVREFIDSFTLNELLDKAAADSLLAYIDAALAAAEPPQQWRHIKRGTVYTEIGRAELQMQTDLVEGATLVIYRGEDGKLWARQEDEFEDGRFEKVERIEATADAPPPARDETS